MPAPAVYVIAVVGTVGVAIAFKEFVYPHIAPRIDRWKAEFQAAQRKRAEAKRSAVMAEVSLIQKGADEEDDDSDNDHSDVRLGKGTSTSRASAHPYMRNGLLVRRRSGRSEIISSKPGDVELDWIAGSQQLDLRSRKDTGFLDESTQHTMTPFQPTAPLNRSIRTGDENPSQIRSSHISIGPQLNKTAGPQAFLDESIQALPYTPLLPNRTPTPTHVLYNSSSTHSPFDSPFSTPSHLPEEALLSKLKTDVTNTSTLTHSLAASLQPSSPSPCTADMSSASKSESFTPSPPGLNNTVAPGVAPLLPAVVDDTMDSSVTSLPSLASLSLPPALPLSSPPPPPPPQLLSPTLLHPSPYQTPPHVHAIPSLSQSHPLDDLLDYEHGLEMLSPPSPLSRTDSPFELAGLSPRAGLAERSNSLLTRSGEQSSAEHFDSIPNSPSSTPYLSFPSPALSASSVFLSSENGYENDSSPSEIWSNFSSPAVAPSRLGDIGSESLPHSQARLSRPISPLSARSPPSFDVNHPQLQLPRRQQQERNTGWASMRVPASAFFTPTGPQDFDTRHPMTTSNDNEHNKHVDAQTFSPRNNFRMMKTMATQPIATTLVSSTEVHPLESVTRLSRVTISDSDFDTGSELSDLDLLNVSAEEYQASAPAAAVAGGSLGPGSRSMVYTGADSGTRAVARAGGISGPRIADGNESDTSTWSLAGGSE